MTDIKLAVTPERVKDIPLTVFYHIEEGSPKILIDYIAHFMVDENENYLPNEDAVDLLLEGRTLNDLEAIAVDLQTAVEEGIVPNE